MKILVLEYVTGGGLRQEPIPPSLAYEGGLMLEALVADLLLVADIHLLVLHDDRLPFPRADVRAQVLEIHAGDRFQDVWRKALDRCDAVWPIAPETGGILEQLCRDVESAGKSLLTSPAAAVRLAASKLDTVRRLERFGLPVVPSFPLGEWKPVASRPFVIKPDDGVGCEGTRIIRAPGEFRMTADTENWIAQPLLDGEPLSLSALFACGQARLSSCNRQWIRQVGDRFVLKACQVNAIADTDGRWQTLAGQIAQALPVLWGYAGIDLVLGEDGPMILEINPRLTTSYAGLRLATGENPAALTLELLKTGVLPPPCLHPGVAVKISLEGGHGH